MTEQLPGRGPVERPSLGCRHCGASMPLSRTVVLGNHERMLRCPGCGTITRWSLSAVSDLDMREAVDLRDSIDLRDENVLDIDLDVEHHSNGRRRN
jgi:uncharacterized Zn finger protein